MTVEHRGHWPGRAWTSPATHDDDDDDARASRDAGPGLAWPVESGPGVGDQASAARRAATTSQPCCACQNIRVASHAGVAGRGLVRSDEDDRGGEATPRARPLVRPPSLPGLPALRPVFSVSHTGAYHCCLLFCLMALFILLAYVHRLGFFSDSTRPDQTS